MCEFTASADAAAISFKEKSRFLRCERKSQRILSVFNVSLI